MHTRPRIPKYRGNETSTEDTRTHTHTHTSPEACAFHTHAHSVWCVTQYFAITARTIGSINDKCVGAAAQPLFITSPYLHGGADGPMHQDHCLDFHSDHGPKFYTLHRDYEQSTDIGMEQTECQFSTSWEYLVL
jgi:hypothetical protein